jgi:hypothetical protein
VSSHAHQVSDGAVALPALNVGSGSPLSCEGSHPPQCALLLEGEQSQAGKLPAAHLDAVTLLTGTLPSV